MYAIVVASNIRTLTFSYFFPFPTENAQRMSILPTVHTASPPVLSEKLVLTSLLGTVVLSVSFPHGRTVISQTCSKVIGEHVDARSAF